METSEHVDIDLYSGDLDDENFYHVSLSQLKDALSNLLMSNDQYGPATFVTYWLMLKLRGLEPSGSSVLVKEENGGPLLDDLLRVEGLADLLEDDSPYYDVFVGSTRVESADKNYWQTNIGNFYNKTNNSADPTDWLDITEDNGEYFVSYTDEFAEHLGDGADGFGPRDSRLSIPLLDLIAWYYRYERFDDSLPYEELLNKFRDEFNLSAVEMDLVFDESDSDIGDFYEPSLGIDEKKTKLAEYVADNLEAQQNGYSIEFEPDQQPDKFSKSEKERIIYSSTNTTYSTFDPTIDPADDARQAIEDDGEQNLIFVGPPGTGKTHLAMDIAENLGNETFFFQFHESYSYEDFVEAYEPIFEDGEITKFDSKEKRFIDACKEARAIEDGTVFVILDEINRANVSSVFGELFSLIEYREKIDEKPINQYTLYSGEPLVIPDNLIIIGTMNNLDKSTEDLEFALRRRFTEIEVPPSTNKLRDILRTETDHNWTKEELREMSILLNIVNEKGDYPLGHTYFQNTEGLKDLEKTYRRRIRPSIKHYFGRHREDQIDLIDGFFEQAVNMTLSSN